MLIEFRVENHRSIRDEQVLSMQVGRGGEGHDPRPRRVPGSAGLLLPVAGLYGANASGKSNVLSALFFMRGAVDLSHRLFPPEGGFPRDPFAWGEKVNAPSLFEVTLAIEGVRYQYGFVVDDERVLEEWLFAWPTGRKQTWFERQGEIYSFGQHLRGENRVVKELTRANSLFLSAAVQHRYEQLGPLYRWFRAVRAVNVRASRGFPREGSGYFFAERWLAQQLEADSGAGRQQQLFGEDVPADGSIEAVRDLIRAADLGIVGFKVTEKGGQKGERVGAGVAEILLQHRTASGDAWLSLAEESHGTRRLLRLGWVLVDALRQGGMLLVDELEASLHPLLAAQIVDQFNDPVANPRNAQLIFATHDTNLLGTVAGAPRLRRDQVWLTEKDSNGGTVLYPLTDFKPRREENVERGYLQGRYGAVPVLGACPHLMD